jgi:hypothetical protein
MVVMLCGVILSVSLYDTGFQKNTVKNHVKVLDLTDSVDEGHKTGLTSRWTG